MHLRTAMRKTRRGAAVIEMAVLLPLLLFLFVIGVDYARLYYHLVTVTNAARNGCIWGARDDIRANDTDGIKDAALVDAVNLKPAPEVKSELVTDALGHSCLNVTVKWTFKTVSQFPGVPGTVHLTRTVQMRIAPTVPKEI